MPADGEMHPGPPEEVITSSANPIVKYVRSLQRRKIRHQERAFVIEGLRALDDAVRAGVVPRLLVVREDIDPAGIAAARHAGSIRRVSASVFGLLSEVPHPQGMLAVVPMPEEPPLPTLADVPRPLLLIVDRVRDPGNLGTLLRSAAAAGVSHVALAPETVDVYHPRAVRAAAGCHFRIPFSHERWDRLAGYLREFELVGLADARADRVYDSVQWTSSSAIIIGGEAFGPSAEAEHLASVRVSIPLERGVESLNAAVAGSLLMFEAARQRRAVRTPEPA